MISPLVLAVATARCAILVAEFSDVSVGDIANSGSNTIPSLG